MDDDPDVLGCGCLAGILVLSFWIAGAILVLGVSYKVVGWAWHWSFG